MPLDKYQPPTPDPTPEEVAAFFANISDGYPKNCPALNKAAEKIRTSPESKKAYETVMKMIRAGVFETKR